LLSGNDVLWSPASGNAILWTTYALYADTYFVTENVSAAYSTTFSWDCSASGSVVLLPGDTKTCIITNTYIPPVVNAWGSPSSLVFDACPQGDESGNTSDGVCVRATVVGTSSLINSPTPATTSWATSPITPLSNTSPKNTMAPFVFWLTQIENPITQWTVTLPAQLPNSWASSAKNNNVLKILVLVTAAVCMSTIFVIQLKKYIR
jgi:hypothetical protein